MKNMWYGIVLFIGLLMLVLAFYFFYRSNNFQSNGERTLATVVELLENRGSKGAVTYNPRFSYKTIRGQEITYVYNISSEPPMWDIGETVEIIYDPEEPDSIKVVGYFGLYGVSIILASIALPAILIGGGYFIFIRYFH